MVLISAVSEATGATSAVVATHARTARAELTHISEYFSFSLRSGSDTAMYLYPSNTLLEINIVFLNNNYVSGPLTHKRHLLFFTRKVSRACITHWHVCALKISCPQWHHVVVLMNDILYSRSFGMISYSSTRQDLFLVATQYNASVRA